jgi:CheY-like chemotaxis protein
VARILVIDDEPQVLGMFEEFIRRLGHEVMSAHDGDEGLTLMRTTPADLVITDIFMPVKEGLSTIKDLKEEFPDVCIVALTGGARARQVGLTERMDVMEAAGRFGASRVLLKPVDMEELTDVVCGLLQRN